MEDLNQNDLLRPLLLSVEGLQTLLQSLVEPSRQKLLSKSVAPWLFPQPWPLTPEGDDEKPDLTFVSTIPPLRIPREANAEGRGDWVVENPQVFAVGYQALLDAVALESIEAIVHFLDSCTITHQAAAPIVSGDLDQVLAEKFLMNPRDYADLRMFCRDVHDIEHRQELRMTGFMGSYREKAHVIISSGIPLGKVYSTSVLGSCRCVVEPVYLTLSKRELALRMKFKFEFKLAPDLFVHRIDVTR